jgi:hypothetical protein
MKKLFNFMLSCQLLQFLLVSVSFAVFSGILAFCFGSCPLHSEQFSVLLLLCLG